MKILRLSAYYYPEQVANSHLLNDLDEAFANKNIISELCVPTPCRGIGEDLIQKYRHVLYEEKNNGYTRIHRFQLYKEGKGTIARAVRYILQNIKQYYCACRFKDVDLIYAESTPPTQGFLCSLVKKRIKKPFIYNLQDIFPDSMINAGMISKGSILWKIGRFIEDYTYKNADKIIVISEGFKYNLMKKGVQPQKIVVIPNWIDTNKVTPIVKENNPLFERYSIPKEKFIISYCGNIGHSQNLELLIQIAEELDKEYPNILFVLIGEGANKEALSEEISNRKLTNVLMLPFQPYEDIASVFSLGDIGLVISKPGIGTSSVPSKTLSILAAGKPVIASFDINSELANLVKSLKCGLVCSAGNKAELKQAILRLYNNEEDKNRMGVTARDVVVSQFDRNICVEKYIEVLKGMKIDE